MQYLGHTYTKDSIHCFSEIHIEPIVLHFCLLSLVINWLMSLQPHILLSPTPSFWPKSDPKGGAEPESKHDHSQIAAKLYTDFWISGWKLFLRISGYWVAPRRLYKPCTYQSSRPKRGPGVSNRDINGLMDRELTCLDQGPGVTPHRVRNTWQQILSKEEREVTSQRGNWHQVGSPVTRETSRGHTPYHPAVKLAWQSCSDPKLELSYIYLKLPQHC